ncbi:MAG: S41 family peptidase [Epulopiscium sp.]|nr:S41 family peptidase [Candidatus Epulonipiscium sp.]
MKNKKTFFGGFIAGIILTMLLNAPLLGFFGVQKIGFLKYGFSRQEQIKVDGKMKQIAAYLDKYYVDGIDKEKLMEGTYTGLVAGVGDPYTVYYNEEDFERFKVETEGSYAGIGVIVSVDPEDQLITIISPFIGSPGEKAGLLPGDKIIQVNGTDVTGKKLDEAVSMIKGPEGTKVTLKIFRKSENDVFTVDVRRATIDVPTVHHEILDDNIGYLKITGFDQVTYKQFMEAYTDLNEKGQKGLIIDVRNNPGGLLHIVAKIADELLPEGLIVYTEDKNGRREELRSDAKQIQVPLVVLTNENSASASEILAGAIKDHGIGTLVGTTTFGKGLVQNIIDLEDGTAIKVTTSKYYTPNGTHIQDIGIEPDYIVELPEELKKKIQLEPEEDLQLQKALQVIQEQLK